MKKFILIFVIIIISVNLLNDRLRRTQAPSSVPDVPKYDFRDKQYQDFYSFYRRQREKCRPNCLPSYFDNKDIEQALGVQDVPENLSTNVRISRINPENDIISRARNHFTSEEDVIAYYDKLKLKTQDNRYDMVSCKKEYKNAHFFDLCRKWSPNEMIYFYLPNSEEKIPYIEQSMNFGCTIGHSPYGQPLNCELVHYTNKPRNLEIRVDFYDPDHFFYVMSYIEKLIFNATGEHIWQTSLKQK